MSYATKTVKRALEHLDPGEKVLTSVSGVYDAKTLGQEVVRRGVLIATEKRLVFYSKRMTGFDFESFPYDRISSIDMGKRLVGWYVSFFVSNNKVSMRSIPDNAANFVSVVQKRLDGSTSQNQPLFDDVAGPQSEETIDAGKVVADSSTPKRPASRMKTVLKWIGGIGVFLFVVSMCTSMDSPSDESNDASLTIEVQKQDTPEYPESPNVARQQSKQFVNESGTSTVQQSRESNSTQTSIPVIREFATSLDANVRLAREDIIDAPYKTQIDQRWYVIEVPESEDALENLIDLLHLRARSRRGFEHHNPATNIYVYVYANRTIAMDKQRGADWLGMSSKDYDDNVNRISIRSERLAKLQGGAKNRHGLSEAQRKQIFNEVLKSEEQAMDEATGMFPESDQLMERGEMWDELRYKYRNEIIRKHGITEDQMTKISVEGILEGFN